MDISVSIILCTRNRAPKLRQVLGGWGRVRIPSGWKVELIVVDNGSTDDTASAVHSAKFANMENRYVHEARNGKAHALNTGLAQARGEFILFTDDDVLVAEDWVEKMVLALRSNGCHAVTGRTSIARELQRPWLTSMHKWWLASSEDAQPNNGSRELIGANVGLRRSVLERVPLFDPELGPGALGLAEDSLLGWQLVEAGLRIGYATQASAIHQFDASRLTRAGWLNEARKHGRSEAYLMYHWEHRDLRFPRLKRLCYRLKLQLRRLVQKPPSMDSEGCPLWEMSYLLHAEMCEQFLLERRRPRNYERHGLRRVNP